MLGSLCSIICVFCNFEKESRYLPSLPWQAIGKFKIYAISVHFFYKCLSKLSPGHNIDTRREYALKNRVAYVLGLFTHSDGDFTSCAISYNSANKDQWFDFGTI
jgi:hypothetical protein